MYGFNPQQNYMQQPSFTCHPVTSREEAVAAQTDYFSAGLVMPDLGHGCIYLKRFNPNTGASDFFRFVMEPEAPKVDPYVTRKEFEEFVHRLKKEAEDE